MHSKTCTGGRSSVLLCYTDLPRNCVWHFLCNPANTVRQPSADNNRTSLAKVTGVIAAVTLEFLMWKLCQHLPHISFNSIGSSGTDSRLVSGACWRVLGARRRTCSSSTKRGSAPLTSLDRIQSHEMCLLLKCANGMKYEGH